MKISELIGQFEAFLESVKIEVAKNENAAPASGVTPSPKVLVPEGSVVGGMSIFGLNWDGSDDEGDEEPDGTPLKGAWGDCTHDKDVMWCALPIKTLTATFGSTAKPKGYTVWTYSLVTYELKQSDILDKGPAARVHRPIDGTYALHNALGHLDYGIKKYGSYAQFPATFPVIYWIEDGHGLIKPVKGWDNVTNQVE